MEETQEKIWNKEQVARGVIVGFFVGFFVGMVAFGILPSLGK